MVDDDTTEEACFYALKTVSEKDRSIEWRNEEGEEGMTWGRKNKNMSIKYYGQQWVSYTNWHRTFRHIRLYQILPG